jgi:hypothetical protein
MRGDFTYRESVSIGAVFRRAFDLIRLYPGATLGSALLVGFIPLIAIVVLFVMLGIGFVTAGDNGIPPALTVFVVVAGVWSGAMAASLATQAAMTRALLAHDRGEPVTFRACLAGGFGKLVPLLGLSFVMVVGLMIGFVLLTIPGIMLTIMWSVAAPALVAEDLGILAALERSSALTRGSRWKIFGLGAFALALDWIVLTVFDTLQTAVGAATLWSDMLGAIGTIGGALMPMIFWTMCIALWGVLSASLYVELRTAREGPMTDSLAEVFA